MLKLKLKIDANKGLTRKERKKLEYVEYAKQKKEQAKYDEEETKAFAPEPVQVTKHAEVVGEREKIYQNINKKSKKKTDKEAPVVQKEVSIQNSSPLIS